MRVMRRTSTRGAGIRESGHTRNWTAVAEVTLNPERDSVIRMALGNDQNTRLAA